MATLRVGKCYRPLKRPYTRKSKFKKKNYIRAFPNHKIQKFIMGNVIKNFNTKIILVSLQDLNIRHNALESSRLVVHRFLTKKLGDTNYKLQLNVYPHHALRENKMLGGAHADRLQTGMAHSFGKVIGVAARVKKGNVIMTTFTNKENVEIAKEALKKSFSRLPGKCTVKIEPILQTV